MKFNKDYTKYGEHSVANPVDGCSIPQDNVIEEERIKFLI